MYQMLYARICGLKPLLLHNGQLADPCNPITRASKEITAKRAKKTERDNELLGELEWIGGLYLAEPLIVDGEVKGHGDLVRANVNRPDDVRVEFYWEQAEGSPQPVTSSMIVIPGNNLEAMLVKGAKKSRLGTDFKTGVIVEGNPTLMHDWGDGPIYDHVKDQSKYDARLVVVDRKRIVRRRPMFKRWAVDFQIDYLPSVVNKSQIEKALNDAGLYVGMGDFAPRFGKFSAELSDQPFAKASLDRIKAEQVKAIAAG